MGFKKTIKASDDDLETSNADGLDWAAKTGSFITPWLLEAASLLASMACIVAIMVLLSVRDNKPIPDWGPITLNGIISVLSDLAHAALMYPVSEAIGQLKWLWYWNYKQPRRIDDFDVYNCATRGFFGSLWLLFNPRLWNFSSFGALLTVAALAMQFFLQLMPTYRSEPVRIDQEAILTRAVNYTEWIPPNGGLAYGSLPAGAVAAFSNGVFGPDVPELLLQSTCPTGNCTWPVHQSLGICSVCANVSDVLKWVRAAPEPPHPSAWMYMTQQYTTYYQFSNGMVTPRIWARLSNYSIYSGFYLYWDVANEEEAKKVRPNAFECMYHFCVNTFAISMTSGTINYTVIDTWPNATTPLEELEAGVSTVSIANGLSRNRLKNTVIRPPNGEIVSYIPIRNTAALSSYIGLSFGSMINWNSKGYADEEKFNFESIHQHGGPMFEQQKIALSLTVHMRSYGVNGTDTIIGDSFSVRTFVQVRWKWAILPLVLLALALVFLLATVIMGASRRVPVWKNSSLPSLIYRLDGDLAGFIAGSGPKLSDLEKEASKHSMAMRLEGNTWRLEGQANKQDEPR